MRQLIFIIGLVISGSTSYAQTNYVATTPSATPGADNTLVGVGAGNLNMSGASNLFIGRGTGVQNMAGTQNAFLGASSGSQNTSGQNNSFVGFGSGFSNTTGNSNTFLGSGTGYTNSTGFNNAFADYRAGYFNSVGSNNAFFGTGAGYSNTQGNDNTFVGSDAGSGNNTGTGNTFVGSLSGASNGGGGTQNTFVGAGTGVNNIAEANTFLGFQTGNKTTTGRSNVFIGQQAGFSNTVGISNMFVGSLAGYSNTSGGFNVFMGPQAGSGNITGSYNMFIGNASGQSNTAGAGNTAIGDGALQRNITGLRNTAIGQYAGVESRNDENTFIGFGADVTPATPNLTNVAAIGARARVSQSNSIIIGNNANVGIGNTAPNNKLEITQGTNGNSGLRFTNLTSGTTALVLNQTKFLTVNAQGDVVLGSVNGSGRLAADGADGFWKVDGENLQNTNGGGVIIGAGVGKTPVGYKLYVADGILTEKVKVAVKSTSDWSDRVFESGYRLRGLGEVEAFVHKNGHLPGVPSADEVVKEGVDVGQMQAKLLEKVEELTLYVIELKKHNDALRKKSNNLERRINKIQVKPR